MSHFLSVCWGMEYMDYYIFPAGITLAIPEIEAEEIEDVPPWKRGLLNE